VKDGWSYGGVESDRCIEDFVRILDDCFAVPEPWARSIVEGAGRDVLRFLRGKRGTKGALIQYPMGQYFGGRRVSMTGIGAVGTLPAERGGGVATALMSECVRDIRAAGVPLSALRELYDRVSRHRNGHLSRNEYLWSRVWSPVRSPARGFVVEEDGAIEGYLFFTRSANEELFQKLMLTDFVAATPRAARRLYSFLGDYSSLGDVVLWHDGPGGSLMQFLPRVSFEVSVHMHWMLRIVDVPAALEARGYPLGLEGELHFAVEDPVIPENTGKWVLRVANGSGTVEPGGRGELRIGERGLASLYSSFMAAESIALCGMAAGDERTLAAATAIFGGPAPGMGDMF